MNAIIKKAVLAAAVTVQAAGITARADTWEKTAVDVDYDSNIVTVSGVLPVKTEADISVIVLNPGCTAADLSEQDYSTVVNYSDQISSEADGSFSFSYTHEGADGRYNIIMSVKSYNITDNEHSFLAASSQSDILADINAAKAENSEAKMEAALARAMSAMTLNCTDYDEFIAVGGSNSEVCQNLAADVPAENIAGLKEQIKKSVMLVRFNHASASEIEALTDYYAEYIGINKSTAYATYKEKAGSAAKQRINAVMASKEFDVNTDINGFFTETVITQAVNEAVSRLSYGDIKTIIADNAAAAGIDLSLLNGLKYPDNVYKSLLASEYNTLAELKTAFDSAAAKQRAAEAGGGGSTGSSGSAGSGSSGSSSSGSGSSGGGSGTAGSGSMPSISSGSSAAAFDDMDSASWAETAVNSLQKRGIVNGRGNNKFDPLGNVTREEFAKMLSLALGLSKPQGSTPDFSDVKDGEWYYEPVMKLAARELVNGIGNGMFGVGTNITREDAAVMIYRAMQYTGAEMNAAAQTDFTDHKAVADYARSAVAYLHSAGVVNGMEDGSFAPKDNVNRAQAAVIIYNMLVFCGI